MRVFFTQQSRHFYEGHANCGDRIFPNTTLDVPEDQAKWFIDRGVACAVEKTAPRPAVPAPASEPVREPVLEPELASEPIEVTVSTEDLRDTKPPPPPEAEAEPPNEEPKGFFGGGGRGKKKSRR